MNLHAPAPIVEEMQAVAPPVDEVARLLDAAKLGTEAALLDAIEARRTQIALSLKALDLAAGLAAGHASKCIGPGRTKTPTTRTLFALLDALGLSVVLVNDPSKASGVALTPRNASKVRTHGAVSQVALDRARPHVLAELARKARHPKWKAMPTTAFLQAMMESNT